MIRRVATCLCGAFTATCIGEPVRVSVCHCHDCQRRSGSAFAVQARYPDDRVTLSGERRSWSATGQGGATFHFCPTCGSTIAYDSAALPGLVAIAVGAFADRGFPAPTRSVWEERRHPWATITGKGIDHLD